MFLGKTWSEFRNHCKRKNFNRKQCEKFLEEVKNVLYPFGVITKQDYINSFKSIEGYEEEKLLLQLKDIVIQRFPQSRYTGLKKELMIKGNLA